MKTFLIHSFGTNSVILSGLRKSLEKKLEQEVEIIDLPGFNRRLPPLKVVTWDSICDYVEEYLSPYQDEEILIGGISFGFGVVSRLDLSKYKVKGVFAIEPFVGNVGLNVPNIEISAAKIAIKMANRLHAESFFFNERFLQNIFHVPDTVIEEYLSEFDPQSFYAYLHLLLSDESKCELDPKYKYVLILNPDDTTLRYKEVMKVFQEPNVLHIKTAMSHYPTDLSEEFFTEALPDMKPIFEYLDLKPSLIRKVSKRLKKFSRLK